MMEASPFSEWLTIDPVYTLRSLFLLASCTILFANAIPALRMRFIVYGARSTPPTQVNPSSEEQRDITKATITSTSKQLPPKSILGQWLDSIAAWRVPHGYFIHFYVVSTLSSLFWAEQILARGQVYSAIASRVETRDSGSMSFNQLVVCWALMAAQGARRLVECILLSRPSQSKMWFIHWILGISFYLAMGISIWVEGIHTLHETSKMIGDARIEAPSLRTMVFLPVFVIASGIQHDCHFYLASLKKYTVPSHPAFQRLLCPHYTAECVVYLSLAFLAAPQGHVVNRTILTAFVFVAINLGVSAQISKEWYEEKFGASQIAGRWKMIPAVY